MEEIKQTEMQENQNFMDSDDSFEEEQVIDEFNDDSEL